MVSKYSTMIFIEKLYIYWHTICMVKINKTSRKIGFRNIGVLNITKLLPIFNSGVRSSLPFTHFQSHSISFQFCFILVWILNWAWHIFNSVVYVKRFMIDYLTFRAEVVWWNLEGTLTGLAVIGPTKLRITIETLKWIFFNSL